MTTRHRSSASLLHPSRPAFTVIEVLLALGLASIVAVAALSMLGMMSQTDRRAAERFEGTGECNIAHLVISRALQSLVAAPPRPDDVTTPPPDEVPPPEGEVPPPAEGEEALAGLEGEAAPPIDESLAQKLSRIGLNPRLVSLLAPVDDPERLHFALEYADGGAAFSLPRLELVVGTSPAPLLPVRGQQATSDDLLEQRVRESVRGAFELIRMDDGWAMQWTPIEPAGRPYVLLRRVTSCEWSVLPRSKHEADWTDVWSAVTGDDYPVAVRLILQTELGVSIDWLFEISVTEGELP